ncbi:hypothetical protein PROFUN_12391 [Planoprotostelium fungivorum]|uniref:Uncharacterized protein n=1 Tax=Planoprotostelium fungivorum TaxID=1890364 RepID=A0A2P6N7H2_9EUKA|nr:hypothetical protein PROFUN_12391 [Planoprotostelium fungivorum]
MKAFDCSLFVRETGIWDWKGLIGATLYTSSRILQLRSYLIENPRTHSELVSVLEHVASRGPSDHKHFDAMKNCGIPIPAVSRGAQKFHAVKQNHAHFPLFFKTTTTQQHAPDMNKIFLVCLLSLLLTVQGGPLLGVFCISACNAGYVACCTSLGVTAGTFTLGAGVPIAVATCSVAQGACMTACAIAPTP